MSNTPLIQLQSVSKTYQTGKIRFNALSEIYLTIGKGEYIAILGPSGSGKSTLMHIIGCLSTPTSGSYLLEQQEVSRLTRNQLAHIRNQKIGFVFQSFNLLPQLSAMENLTLPLIYKGTSLSERRHKALNLLKGLGLTSHAIHRPNELSGGQQQRIAIARALITDPDILLADEPTGNLDSQSGTEVIELFETFATNGKTIIIVTHDEKIAKRAQRIVQIKDGRIVGD
jgi:putative ABC transport system ATP-binding protein